MDRHFLHCKSSVSTRGIPSDSFLNILIDWGKSAPDDIFAPNDKIDIYSSVKLELGPFATKSPLDATSRCYRRAAMLECLRVLAGFESSWNWNEGVDVTNKTSMAHIEGQETGIFQVSFDSLGFDPSLRVLAGQFCRPSLTPRTFIDTMKQNHPFALEYAARLLRFTVRHNGPVLRKEINPWLRRAAVSEFESFLS